MTSFLESLSWRDRRRLRAVVRRVHLAHYPRDRVTDAECDRLIESFSPRVREALLRRAIDAKLAG